MADLLGSILGSMEKPPSVGDEEKKRRKEQQKQMEKAKLREREMIDKFKSKIQERINEFIKDSTQEKKKFEPMDKVYRAIVHEMADVAGLTSFSFGQDEIDRYVMLWKKEFAPSDEELTAYRRGEEWDPEKAKELAKQKEKEEAEDLQRQGSEDIVPKSNYREKYEHLIGRSSAKAAAHSTTANKSYGFVPSENKRDLRTIEQVMADSRAKKKQKTEHTSEENETSEPETHQS